MTGSPRSWTSYSTSGTSCAGIRGYLELLGMTSLVLAALAASILLHASPVTWTIWSATTVICIAAAWTIRPGRS